MEWALRIIEETVKADDSSYPVTFVMDFASPFWSKMFHSQLIQQAGKITEGLENEPNINFIYIVDGEFT